MAKVDNLIKKAKEIIEQENEAIAVKFQARFKEIKAVLTFNKLWLGDVRTYPRLRGVIYNHTDRLMLPHGRVAKTTDTNGDSIIMLGTHYGVVVITASPFGSSPEYIITAAFADAWARGYASKFPNGVPQIDRYTTKSPHFLDADFFEHVDELAALDREDGYDVGDGIPLYVPPPKKVKPAREQHWKQSRAATQPLNNSASQ